MATKENFMLGQPHRLSAGNSAAVALAAVFAQVDAATALGAQRISTAIKHIRSSGFSCCSRRQSRDNHTRASTL